MSCAVGMASALCHRGKAPASAVDEHKRRLAFIELEQVVAIDEAVGHPDLASDQAMLAQVRAQLAQTGWAGVQMVAGQTIAGVIVASNQLAIHTVISDILLILDCSTVDEWVNQLQRLPL